MKVAIQLIVFLVDNSLRALTNSDINTVKKECNNLQELLLPENEVKFTHKIGEGNTIHCTYSYFLRKSNQQITM